MSRERPFFKHMPLRDHVYTSVKRAIITGQREPDERLIEETIAAELGTSRTPVREALQKLEKDGLIFRRPAFGFAVKGVTEEEVDDILDLQCVLEGYAGRLAASGITKDELSSLNDLIRLQEACLAHSDMEMFIRLDGEFHDALHRAANNVRLYDLVQGLRDTIDRYRMIVFHSRVSLDLSVKDHKEIVTLMRAKNGKKIEKLIRKHLVRGKNVIKRRIRRQQKSE
jgi:DNA-binding GntR family transcriptional regulator